MNRIIKVVSDIHGYYDEFIRDLKESTYVDNDESMLIVLGDFFDRGSQSVEVYAYLKKLSDEGKAICIRGNHETFLEDFLEGNDCEFNFIHNGFDKTLSSFLCENDAWKNFNDFINNRKEIASSIYGKRVEPVLSDPDSVPREVLFNIFQEYAREFINKNYPELLKWLKERPYYYETDNYIFTHASIDGTCKDWKNPEYTPYDFWSPWEYLTWDDGSFYSKPINNTNKTIVCGHYHTDGIREKFNIKSDGNNSILWSEDGRKIFIDACSPLTHRVNVLTIINEKLL